METIFHSLSALMTIFSQILLNGQPLIMQHITQVCVLPKAHMKGKWHAIKSCNLLNQYGSMQTQGKPLWRQLAHGLAGLSKHATSQPNHFHQFIRKTIDRDQFWLCISILINWQSELNLPSWVPCRLLYIDVTMYCKLTNKTILQFFTSFISCFD